MKAGKWDSHGVKAEIRRRGYTLTSLAQEHGCKPSTIRAAFIRPSRAVNTFIAGLIGQSVHDVWPDWFDADGDLIPAAYRRKKASRRNASAASPDRAAA